MGKVTVGRSDKSSSNQVVSEGANSLPQQTIYTSGPVVERIVYVDKPVIQEFIIEKEVPVYQEKIVVQEKIVEVIKEVPVIKIEERIVEVPTIVEKEVVRVVHDIEQIIEHKRTIARLESKNTLLKLGMAALVALSVIAILI